MYSRVRLKKEREIVRNIILPKRSLKLIQMGCVLVFFFFLMNANMSFLLTLSHLKKVTVKNNNNNINDGTKIKIRDTRTV